MIAPCMSPRGQAPASYSTGKVPSVPLPELLFTRSGVYGQRMASILRHRRHPLRAESLRSLEIRR
jgi:hypothetical protein